MGVEGALPFFEGFCDPAVVLPLRYVMFKGEGGVREKCADVVCMSARRGGSLAFRGEVGADVGSSA
jgi:hypothetical protein